MGKGEIEVSEEAEEGVEGEEGAEEGGERRGGCGEMGEEELEKDEDEGEDLPGEVLVRGESEEGKLEALGAEVWHEGWV